MSGLSREAIERIENMGSPLARAVDFHEEIDSTQRRARALAHEDAPHGTLVLSNAQIGGRGRLGRPWSSPPGGLWMSLVLRPEMSAHFAPRITQAAAVGVAKTLWNFGVEARIKWPNDLLVATSDEPDEPVGRKICGILAESSTGSVPVFAKRPEPSADDSRLDFVLLGIGLNVNLDREDLQVPYREVATLRSELGHDVNLAELLGSLLSNLEVELERIEDFGAILDDWRMLNCTLGKRVRVWRLGKALEGWATDLTPEGALLLEMPEGPVEIFEGEVEHLWQGGT